MTLLVSRLPLLPLPLAPAPALDRRGTLVYDSFDQVPSAGRRALAVLGDGGLLLAGVWSIPFVLIALVTPLALTILGLLQLARLVRNAF